jgi:hypothetical protein
MFDVFHSLTGQPLAYGVNPETVRRILTNIGPERCDVYAFAHVDDWDSLDGVQWLQDNPAENDA